MKKNVCIACRKPSLELMLDLGPQPLCNRFPVDEREPEFAHPLRFGACSSCGAAQLIDPPAHEEILPRYNWLTYKEPETHLDSLADRLVALAELTPGSTVCGVSSKDHSLLRRLNERGIKNTWTLDPKNDLGEPDKNAFVETVQALLTPASAKRIAARRGGADLVVARHIIEHAQDPVACFQGILRLLKPGGRILLEAPDCSRAMKECDYSMLWEEHALYMTPQTFPSVITALGGDVEHYEEHPYPLENSMVALARAGTAPRKPDPSGSLALARRFAESLPKQRREVHAFVDDVLAGGGKIAVFGAGHFGGVWVNVLGLRDKIACFIDDNPNKKGLRMAGSRLPIKGSETLMRDGITWALMAFSPDAEDGVIGKHQDFQARGGRFASILPGSKRRLELGAAFKV